MLMQNERLPWILGCLQVLLLALIFGCTTYQDDIASGYSLGEYAIFRDILVMLLIGFGFLMSFLHKYGLGAVGFTLMLTALSMQLNILVELLCRYMNEPSHVEFPHPIHLTTLVDAEFAAATLLISFGAIIGRASPLQLIVMTLMQSFFYALNKVVIVLGAWKAEDVGGTITIHMMGAYFGMGVSRVLGEPKGRSKVNADSSAVSDVMGLIGTTILWVYWPSFVGATETANPATEHLCIMHTVLALLGSTVATFCFSSRWTQGNKFDPVHVANATLAGGVAIGASARLEMTPGGALLLGILAGGLSTFGYAYGTPFCEDYLKMFDTCGVHNLHGLPSVLGGLASAIFVAIDDDAEFLHNDGIPQPVRQILAVLTTIALAVSSGFLTGIAMKFATLGEASFVEEYNDAMWWEGCYMQAMPQDELDLSAKSKASISPIVIVAEEEADA
ncbi:Ammonium transporter Rh type [Seminavis robusta]|uniref:Ammonium transporter Rh type n=1 Tax=Seminavis robusta TaxID=568900 RepID=A0A9N8D6S4_9STRA|nr:Ammonium transporter Rh type [Seminavis robusta]|eukprot:Sro15_g011080.1 Ammonium transporter Rh type (446) ;mRNA; f:66829-68166